MKAQIVRHGEVILKPITEIPKEAKLLEKEKEFFMVAHSETGHHHVLELTKPALSVFELNGEMFLDMGDVGTLVHKKIGSDVHAPHKIAPGKYKVVIKQAFDYFKGLLARVRD